MTSCVILIIFLLFIALLRYNVIVVEETGESVCIILYISIIGSMVLSAAKGKRRAKQELAERKEPAS